MIDEYTGKKLVSPLDFTSPERSVIGMLSKQGKTVKESADFLRELARAIDLLRIFRWICFLISLCLLLLI